MFDKKKRNFLILVLIFGTMTIISLLNAWRDSNYVSSGNSMMGQSMGGMMSSMHLQNVTINDLITQQEQMETAPSASQDEHSGHHSETQIFLKSINTLTTGTIVILLPFIIAGTIFLAILWFNNQKPGDKS